MALTEAERLTLIIILAVVMIVVIFFEMRVMRSKSREVRRANMKKDEAFNAILTTRSVMNALSNQGNSTGNAAILLERAKGAMDRGDYEGCVDMCAKARSELTRPSKPGPIPAQEPTDSEAGESLQKVAENILSEEMPSQDATSYKGTKLSTGSEGNYLGAKFEMSKARADISRLAKGGVDISRAETLMAQADSSFAGGNYDKALSFAVRARRALTGEESEPDAVPLRTEAEERAETEAGEAEVYDVEEEKTPSGYNCSNCGKLIDPTDLFCGNCGARTTEDRVCKNCGAKAKREDTFCRKCGERV